MATTPNNKEDCYKIMTCERKTAFFRIHSNKKFVGKIPFFVSLVKMFLFSLILQSIF